MKGMKETCTECPKCPADELRWRIKRARANYLRQLAKEEAGLDTRVSSRLWEGVARDCRRALRKLLAGDTR